MPLNLTIETRLNGSYTGTADLGTPTFAFDQTQRKVLDSGVGANQADVLWSDERTVTTGATDSIDLAGALSGLLGGTVTFVRVKGIRIRNSNNAGTANTTNLTVQRPAANGAPLFVAASDAIAALPPDGEILISWPSAAGVVVTAGTGDLLEIVNSAGASAVYRIEVWGGLS
jgi:hypothetical protein